VRAGPEGTEAEPSSGRGDSRRGSPAAQNALIVAATTVTQSRIRRIRGLQKKLIRGWVQALVDLLDTRTNGIASQGPSRDLEFSQ
jgi:hypothetical protein